MSRKPALFNEALAGFFRATEVVATQRAEAGKGSRVPAQPAAPEIADPNPLAGGPPDDERSDRDWLADASRAPRQEDPS